MGRRSHCRDERSGFGEAALYLESLTERGCSPATVQTRRASLAVFSSYTAGLRVARVQDVTADVIGAYRLWLIDRGLKPSTIATRLSGVRLLFGWLEEKLLLFSNPAAGLVTPGRRAQLPQVLTASEVRTLLDTPDTSRPLGLRDRAILELLYSTGMRRHEATILPSSGVDLDRQTVRVLGKGSRERVVPVGKCAVEHIRRYVEVVRPQLAARSRQEYPQLWLNKDGEPLSEQILGLIPLRYAREAGIAAQVSPHTLRRSCATHMLQNGAHPLMVSEMLGHADTKTIAHYLRVSVSDLKETHARSNPGR